jgi:hypothetical protein
MTRSPEQVRAALQADARRYGDEHTIGRGMRWAVIRAIELAWAGETGREQSAARRAVTAYLFGQPSTKLLSDAHIHALYDWVGTMGSVRDELRAVARAALVEAGQAEMPA